MDLNSRTELTAVWAVSSRVGAVMPLPVVLPVLLVLLLPVLPLLLLPVVVMGDGVGL